MKKYVLLYSLLLLIITPGFAQKERPKGFASCITMSIGGDVTYEKKSGFNFRIHIPVPNPYFRIMASYSRYNEEVEEISNHWVTENLSESSLALQAGLLSHRHFIWYATSGISVFNTQKEFIYDPNKSYQPNSTKNERNATLMLGTGVDFKLSKRMGSYLDIIATGEGFKVSMGLRFNLMKIEYPDFL